MALFTAETAVLAARKSHEHTSARFANRVARPSLPEMPQDVLIELGIVEEQIAHARDALNDDTPYCPACERCALEPHHRAQLMKSLLGFLDKRQDLLGRPKISPVKPHTGKPKRQSAEPIDVHPIPPANDPNEPNG